VYSNNLYHEKLTENEQASSFVEYDLRSWRLKDLLHDPINTVIELSRKNLKFYNATEQLFENLAKLDSTNSVNSEKILTVFNSSSLKDLINCPDIEYINNEGLSDEHNSLLAKTNIYSSIIDYLYPFTKESILAERPYIFTLSRGKDSIDVGIAYGLYGKVNGALFTYNNDTITVDSLPLNIGRVNGEISFIVTDSITNKVSCTRNTF